MDSEDDIPSAYPCKLEDCAKDKYGGDPLVCAGCAHSASGDGFPGRPSGERPCHFCTRNLDLARMQLHSIKRFGKPLDQWYDGSKVKKVPMDCYISVDRLHMDVPEGSITIT